MKIKNDILSRDEDIEQSTEQKTSVDTETKRQRETKTGWL